jgi:hypothetical protein
MLHLYYIIDVITGDRSKLLRRAFIHAKVIRTALVQRATINSIGQDQSATRADSMKKGHVLRDLGIVARNRVFDHVQMIYAFGVV